MTDEKNISALIKGHISDHGHDPSQWPDAAQDHLLNNLLQLENTTPPPASDLLQARILKATHPLPSDAKTPYLRTWQAIAATLVISLATGLGLGQYLQQITPAETEYMLADAYTDDFEILLEIQ